MGVVAEVERQGLQPLHQVAVVGMAPSITLAGLAQILLVVPRLGVTMARLVQAAALALFRFLAPAVVVVVQLVCQAPEVALILQLQAVRLVAVIVLLALPRLVALVAPFPLTAQQPFLLVAPLMRQEVLAPLQLFCLLEHIWLLLAVAVVVQVLALTAVLVELVGSTALVVAAAAQAIVAAVL